MERAMRVASVWNWLPVFRAVCEMGGLRRASEALGVSASAVSRTIKLIEEHLACELFQRDGYQITPNEDGKRLLESVRLAMRTVDEGIEAVVAAKEERALIVSCPGPFVGVALANVMEASRASAETELFSLRAVPDEDLGDTLRRGLVDIALTQHPVGCQDLEIQSHLAFELTVFGAGSNPQLNREDALASVPFAAPMLDEDGQERDGWPIGQERTVAYRVTQMFMAVDLCRAGQAFAFLPEPIGLAAGLQKWTDSPTRPGELFRVTRPQLSGQSKLGDFLTRLSAID